MLNTIDNILLSGGKRTVLIVDDEDINRELLGATLEDIYEIVYACNGVEALQIIRENRENLSLVLLDLQMPEMNGREVLLQMKKEPELSYVPVIVLTSEKDAEVESLTLGAIDFIPKPYPKPPVIRARVQRTIELIEGWDLIRLTEFDSLTGLCQREYFYRYSTQLDRRNKEVPMDAIVIDINHFHILNERHGKAFGDEVLKGIGEKIKEIAESSGGYGCRLKADTFLLYCPHRSDYYETLEYVAGGMDPEIVSDNRVRLRMGVYPEVDKTLEIERRFDRAKLAANTIRGSFAASVAIYDNALHELEIFEDQLLEEFDNALKSGQFMVYYQPKFDIRPDVPTLESAEALVRWKHPEKGMISPGVFVPLFEKHGLVRDLDQFVWETAAAQIREWKDRLGISVPVSVNVSRVDMYDPDLVNILKGILDKNDLTGDDIFLEITESAYTDDSDQIIETVHKMRAIGFRVEMDDFGTGYSSLNMISTLPIDVLKLDLQFIRNAFSGRKNTRMLEVVLDIAEALRVPTIAEGVETAEQMLTLRMMGCDYAQGYYFSKPVPREEFEPFLLKKKEEPQAPKAEVPAPAPKKAERVQRVKKREYNNIAYESLHDPLTGLYNFTAYDLLFKDADRGSTAVLIAVVDDYKFLNDRYGQAVADNEIKRIADVLREHFRSVDHICRISKDEFVVMISRVSSSQQDAIVEKVRQINEKLNRPEGDVPPVTLSVGLAFSDMIDPDEDLFQHADSSLRRLKEEGRRGCSIN